MTTRVLLSGCQGCPRGWPECDSAVFDEATELLWACVDVAGEYGVYVEDALGEAGNVGQVDDLGGQQRVW